MARWRCGCLKTGVQSPWRASPRCSQAAGWATADMTRSAMCTQVRGPPTVPLALSLGLCRYNLTQCPVILPAKPCAPCLQGKRQGVHGTSLRVRPGSVCSRGFVSAVQGDNSRWTRTWVSELHRQEGSAGCGEGVVIVGKHGRDCLPQGSCPSRARPRTRRRCRTCTWPCTTA